MSSALDDLVSSLQAAASSAETAHNDGAQAGSNATEASQAAAAFGREDDVATVEALSKELDEANSQQANLKEKYEELLQRAIALQGGGT